MKKSDSHSESAEGTPSPNGQDSRHGRTAGAESSRKLLGVLLAYDENRPAWTVPDLADHLGVPLSSVYRYVALLREVGLLTPSTDSDGTYRLTDRIISLARAASDESARLVRIAHDHLVSLRDRTGETTLLIRRGGHYAYCADRVESTHPVRLQFDIGAAMPLHSGSASRLLLAAMPRAERRSYLADVSDQFTPAHKKLLTDDALDTVAALGWTESFEEVDAGIWGVGAAITDSVGVVAALASAGPLYRLDPSKRADFIAEVRQAAARISDELSTVVVTPGTTTQP